MGDPGGILETGEKLTFTTKSHSDNKMCWICELKEILWNGLLDFLPSYLDLWGTRRSLKHFPDIPGRYRVIGTLVLKRERSGLLFLGMDGWDGESVFTIQGGSCGLLSHFTWAPLFLFIRNMVSEYPFFLCPELRALCPSENPVWLSVECFVQ